jgi:hypothetical protein
VLQQGLLSPNYLQHTVLLQGTRYMPTFPCSEVHSLHLTFSVESEGIAAQKAAALVLERLPALAKGSMNQHCVSFVILGPACTDQADYFTSNCYSPLWRLQIVERMGFFCPGNESKFL